MNIKDYWDLPLPESIEHIGAGALQEMLSLRCEAYQGFAKIESEKGFLRPTMSLSTSAGQEAVRVLLLRAIEEWLEALDAEDEAHQLEELIDCWNYASAMLIIDPTAPLTGFTSTTSAELSRQEASRLLGRPVQPGREVEPFDLRSALYTFIEGLHPVLESLRNRAWQNSPQSSYFDGWKKLLEWCSELLVYLVGYFGSWELFIRYYYTKHQVLMFRIKSAY